MAHFLRPRAAVMTQGGGHNAEGNPMKIVDVEKAPSTWTKLEKTIHEARNMAFLLTAAIDCDDEFYGEDKRDAIAFGIYEVEARIKEIRQAYHNAHEEGRTIRSEGEATTFTDDDGNKKKIVNLH
jgi:hypothetical protein